MLGYGFLYHGFPKLFTVEGRAQFVDLLTGIGVPAPGVTAWLLACLEVFGGVALILGMLTTTFSMLLILHMVVAMVTVHWRQGFNFMQIEAMTPEGPRFGLPGFEVNLLYIAGLLALAIGGPGHLSIDRRRRHPLPAVRYSQPTIPRRVPADVSRSRERETIGAGM
jgi:putative oxidoreductase